MQDKYVIARNDKTVIVGLDPTIFFFPKIFHNININIDKYINKKYYYIYIFNQENKNLGMKEQRYYAKDYNTILH